MNRSEIGKIGAERSKIFYKEKRNKKIEEYSNNPKKCKECQKEIPYDNRKNIFCNRSCSVSFNNKGIDRWGKDKKTCKKCKKEIKSRTSFCGKTCQKDYISELYWEKIISGNISDINRPTVKKYLILDRGNQCQICELEKWNGKDIPLVMDHIDGNSSNNSLDNLRLICNNCDAQLPTYKGRNRGNGRKERITNK
jgi:hypothetical protein